MSTGPSLRTRVLVGYPCGHHQATVLGRGWMVKGLLQSVALCLEWRLHSPAELLALFHILGGGICELFQATVFDTHFHLPRNTFLPLSSMVRRVCMYMSWRVNSGPHMLLNHTPCSISLAVGSLPHPHSCPDRAPVSHQYPLLYYTLIFRNPFLESLRMY